MRDFSLQLDEGLNIIEGHNEAGKSTIAAFCAFILYGESKNQLDIHSSWDGLVPEGNLVVSDNGRLYRISRSRNLNAVIKDLSTGEQVHRKEIPGEVFFGLPCDIYRSSAFIGQGASGGVACENISASIENILFTGNENTNSEKAVKALDSFRVSMQHKNGKGGSIYELEQKRDELLSRLRSSSENNAKIIELEGEAGHTQTTLDKRDTAIDKLETCIKYVEYGALIKQFDELEKLRVGGNELKEHHKLIIENASFGNYFPDREYPIRVRSLRSDADSLNEQFEEACRQENELMDSEPDRAGLTHTAEAVDSLGGKNEALNYSKKHKTLSSFFSFCSILLFVLSGVALAAGVYFSVFGRNTTLALVSAGFFVISTALAILMFVLSVRQKNALTLVMNEIGASDYQELLRILNEHDDVAERLNRFSSSLDELEAKKELLDDLRTSKLRELNELLMKWDKPDAATAAEDAERIYEKLDECRTKLERQYAAFSTLKNALEGYDESVIREEYPVICDKYKLLNDSDTRKDINAMKRELIVQKNSAAQLREKLQKLQTELSALYAVTEKPVPIRGELDAVDAEIAAEKRQYDACILAQDSLAAAADNLRMKFVPKLSELTSRYMSESSGGNYKTVDVASDMSLSYRKADDDSFRSMNYLSAGSSDLAYISLRLALISTLCKRSVPPVIFDESFARMDDERLYGLFKVIAGYCAEGHQVIVLTSQKRDALIAEGITHTKHIIL